MVTKLYRVLAPIHLVDRDLVPGDVVTGGELGIYLPDLLAQGAVEEED